MTSTGSANPGVGGGDSTTGDFVDENRDVLFVLLVSVIILAGLGVLSICLYYRNRPNNKTGASAGSAASPKAANSPPPPLASPDFMGGADLFGARQQAATVQKQPVSGGVDASDIRVELKSQSAGHSTHPTHPSQSQAPALRMDLVDGGSSLDRVKSVDRVKSIAAAGASSLGDRLGAGGRYVVVPLPRDARTPLLDAADSNSRPVVVLKHGTKSERAVFTPRESVMPGGGGFGASRARKRAAAGDKKQEKKREH